MQIRVALALALLAGCAHDGGPVARIATARGAVEVTLEVVQTPEAMQRGLMYRTALADGHGMLFVFADDSDHSFWMKNTLIPLDMLFIAADGRIVGIHANATPLSLANISVGKPSRYVLEVPGGWTARKSVATGDRVELRGVSGIAPAGPVTGGGDTSKRSCARAAHGPSTWNGGTKPSDATLTLVTAAVSPAGPGPKEPQQPPRAVTVPKRHGVRSVSLEAIARSVAGPPA
jgi:hypothetical protein